jgi:hypothetical protein
MKAKVVLISLILLGTTFGANAQSDVFERLSNEKHVTVVTITKTLLNMMPKAVDEMDVEGMKISEILGKLEHIDVFTTEDAAAKKIMRDGANALLKNNKSYEALMKMKDEGQEMGIYIERGAGDLIESLIMFVDDDDESVLIRLLGNFTIEDIQKVTEGFDM